MFRWAATRLSTGAAAGAAAAAAASSSQSHARVRPALYVRPTEDRPGPAKPASEASEESEGWLPFNVDGESVVFGPEEVREAIDDIRWMANGEQADAGSDGESIESFGADADDIIAQNEARRPLALTHGAGVNALANFTEKLLSRPTMQVEFIEALKEDDDMRSMFGELARQQGSELQIIQRPPMTLQNVVIEELPDDEGNPRRLNFFDNLVRDIGSGLEAAGHFLGKVGRWVKAKVRIERPKPADPDEPCVVEEELGVGEKVAGAVLCFAALVMCVMVAKRMGILRILRV